MSVTSYSSLLRFSGSRGNRRQVVGTMRPGIAGVGRPGDDARVSWEYLHPWVLSLEVALVATVANGVLAIPLSYALAQRRFPLRFAVDSVVILPLVLPPTVVGFGLLYLLGSSGLYGWTCSWLMRGSRDAHAFVYGPGGNDGERGGEFSAAGAADPGGVCGDSFGLS